MYCCLVAMLRDHYRYGLGQWEETLLCNVSSHWPSPYSEWSLHNDGIDRRTFAFPYPNAMLRNTMGTMRPCKIQFFADFTTSMKSKNWQKNIYVNFVGVGIGLEYFIMICRFIYHLPHYNVQLVGCWYTPWCQDMGTLSALLAICEGNPSVTVVPTTDTQSSDVGVAVILNELLKKQSSWRWFETH